MISQRILMLDILNFTFNGTQMGEILKWRALRALVHPPGKSMSHHPKKTRQKIIISKSLPHQSELMFLPGADQTHNLDYFASLLFHQLLLLLKALLLPFHKFK